MSASVLEVPLVAVQTRRRPKSAAVPQDAASEAAGASPADLAFAAYQVLNQACATAVTAVNNANFGPFGNSGSCDYDCSTRTQNWNWNVDYTPMKDNNLLPAVSRTNAASSGFGTAFLPAQTWAGSDLNRYAAQLSSAIAIIKSIDAAIGPTGPTPEQAAQLNAAFNTGVGMVNGSNGESNAALQVLAQFVSGQAPLQGSLAATSSSTQSSIHTSITNGMNDLIGKIACGAGAVTDQFNAMKAVVDQSFTSINPPLSAADGQFATATTAASAIPGVFVNVQSNTDLVLQQLQVAQSLAAGSVMRTLHLDMAMEDWNEMVTYATAQLGS
jgi:hypothetical protein